MSEFGLIVFLGIVLIGVTVAIHGWGTSAWVNYMNSGRAWFHKNPMITMIATATVMLLLHFAEVLVWAVTYIALTDSGLGAFESALYFSLVSFTTVGYGDIVLSEPWRILSGVEALGGVLLLGWSTAVMFGVMQSIWAYHGATSK